MSRHFFILDLDHEDPPGSTRNADPIPLTEPLNHAERPRRVVRYVNAELTISPDDECHVRVELRRDSGEAYIGESSGPCLPSATLETAARAAINAVSEAASLAPGEIRLEGASVTEAFGHRTVLVAIVARDSPTPLVGSCLVLGDTSRATALAVLNATNRFLAIG